MTAIIYFGEMLVASLLAIVLLALSHVGLSSDIALFVCGAVGWTIAEYPVRRFVLHGFAPTEHRLHHANPDGAVLTIFWQIWICFALVYLIAGGAFVAGALVAYAWYLFVHHCAHHGPDTLSWCRCSDTIGSIIVSRRETTALAQPFGITYSGRLLRIASRDRAPRAVILHLQQFHCERLGRRDYLNYWWCDLLFQFGAIAAPKSAAKPEGSTTGRSGSRQRGANLHTD